MNDIVEFTVLETHRRPKVFKDAFEYSPQKGWAWLQRLCFWFLRRIGAFRVGEEASYKRYTFSKGSLLERIYAQRRELFRHFNKEANVLLIGSEDFQELLGEAKDRSMIDITFRAELRDGRRIVGLEVRVVPWMRGMVVLP